jgi:DNA polymerase-4
MDCFYAAVEEKYRPELKGKPVAVGGSPESRSVLTTANYEARKFGLKSAMPSSQAVRLCPQLILIRPNFELYRKESHAVREILRRFTEQIEPLSLDEAYLDVSNSSHFDGSASRIAEKIRALIRDELDLTASAGVAPNKFLAKIASDWKKPNGLFVIRPEDIESFMPTLKVEKIFGVGKVTAQKMHDAGLYTCGDLQKRSLFELSKLFGSRAQDLRDLAYGIDHREVKPHRPRKSLTVEETYRTDLETIEQGLAQIPELYRDWESRMIKGQEKDRIRGFVVKLKFQNFQTTTHEISTQAWPTVADFEKLLVHAWGRSHQPVRLIGIGVRLSDPESIEDLQQLAFRI